MAIERSDSLYRSRLLEMGVDEDELLVLEADVDAEVDTATNEAKAGAAPGEELLFQDVWADGSGSWRN